MPASRRSRLSISAEQVERFATAAGDRNPLHLDPEFARAGSFGVPIVHGALLSLGMLASVPAAELARVRSLRLTFAGPVLPGTSHAVEAWREPDGTWRVSLTGRGQVLARAIASPDADAMSRTLRPIDIVDPAASTSAAASAGMLERPAETDLAQLHAGTLAGGAYQATPGLGVLAAELGAGALAGELRIGLAWASYVVGMQLPGLHSLFAALTLSLDGSPAAALAPSPVPRPYAVSVREHDPRTRLLILDGALRLGPGGGSLRARIDCFARPGPGRPQPLVEPPSEERGSVVVIGASRGFGAALALALLARGYHVHAVQRGAGAELIRLSGPCAGRLHVHTADAGDAQAISALRRELATGIPLTGLILNAAPAILPLRPRAETGAELADYVALSLRVLATPLGGMLSLLAETAWVLFSSSTAVEAPPRDWAHYVSAKGAIEGLAGWLAATAPRLRTVVLRAPAMRTGMTSTPAGHLGALDPQVVAGWTVARLAGQELASGLTVWRPGAEMEAPP